MYSGCDYPYRSFWPCHPCFILQFSIRFILVTILFITLRVVHVYFHQCHLISLVPSPFWKARDHNIMTNRLPINGTTCSYNSDSPVSIQD